MLLEKAAYNLDRECSGGRTNAIGVPLSEYLEISPRRGILTVF